MSKVAPRRILIAAGVALVLLLSLTAVAVVGLIRAGADRVEAARAAAVAAAEELRAVTAGLAAAPAVRYHGSFPSASKDRSGVYTIDVRVARNGALLGILQIHGLGASVLAVGEHTLVKADEEFWRWAGVLDQRLPKFRDRWVVLYDGFFGFDLGQRLSPAVLLAGPAPRGSAKLTVSELTPPVRLEPDGNGDVEVHPVRWDGVTYLITTAEPKRLVRLTAAGEQPARLDLKPTLLDDTARATFFGELRRQAKTLVAARDYGAQPDYAGQLRTAFEASEVVRIHRQLDAELKADE